MQTSLNTHWTSMKNILRYLKATIDLGRTLKKSSNLTLIGYSYVGWGNDLIKNDQ